MTLNIFTDEKVWANSGKDLLGRAEWSLLHIKVYQFFWNLSKKCMDTKGWLLEALAYFVKAANYRRGDSNFSPFLVLATTAVALPNHMYGWHCLGQCLPVSQCVPCTVVTHTSTQLSTAKASGWTPPRLYSKSLSLQCFPASAFWSSSENASVGERLSAINAKQNFCWEGLK